jgi:uncharacterized damage-inducible protein DinB
MHVADLTHLYDYNYWATERVMRAISALTPQQFTQSVAGSYGSIRNTLVHVLSAEWGWLDRCGGLPRGERLKSEDYPTVASLISAWTHVEYHMRRFLSELSDDDLARDVEFAFGGGPKQSVSRGDVLLHAAVHGAHHRGQIALLLRTLGFVPGDFDLLMYAVDQRHPPPLEAVDLRIHV